MASIRNEAHEISSDAAAKPAHQNCTHDALQALIGFCPELLYKNNQC